MHNCHILAIEHTELKAGRGHTIRLARKSEARI